MFDDTDLSVPMYSEICLIIPTYGHFDYAAAAIDSFVKHTYAPQLILLVDDASPDWDQYDWSKFPHHDHMRVRFNEHAGLTRSWNEGLRIARKHKAEYTICTNSDILFTPLWFNPLRSALDTFDLVGPITNAPGHCPWQAASNYGLIRVDDNQETLNRYARVLCSRKQTPTKAKRINGFFMVAKTEKWWECAFDAENVFDPSRPFTGNEDELQRRWRRKGFTIGFSPQSYIFHYRSVSRSKIRRTPTTRGLYRKKRR